MSSTIQDIQHIRSLRSELRNITLSDSILTSIDNIHQCVKSGTDLNGWKRVDWRGGGGNSSGGNSSGGASSRGGGRGGGGGDGGGRGGGDGGGDGGYNRSNNSFKHGNTGRVNNTDSFFTGRSSSHSSFGGGGGGSGGGRSKPHGSSPFGSGKYHNNEHTASIPLSASVPSTQSSISKDKNDKYDTPNEVKNEIVHVHVHEPRVPTTASIASTRYVSRFKKDAAQVDDTILNTILLGKLNKFSVSNYAEVKEFITHIIDSGQTDMMRCFMRIVFQKAASEEIFCPLYAKLLSELSAGFPVLLDEMNNLYEHYMKIFEEVDESTKTENYNEFLKRNIEKKYRRGYSQFLAELIKHDVINSNVFVQTIDTIIKQVENKCHNSEAVQIVEEYADCMMRIVNAIVSDKRGDSKITSIKKYLRSAINATLKQFTVKNTENVGITMKARFTFMDIYEVIEKF
jgi:hypothetical protein